MFKFELLEIWKLANDYADEIYKITKDFPKDEQFNLTNQLRRSSSSIPDNIAEGSGSQTVKDFKNYLQISIKSAFESVSQLDRAKRRYYIDEEMRSRMYNQAEILVRKINSFKKWLDEKGKF